MLNITYIPNNETYGYDVNYQHRGVPQLLDWEIIEW